MLYYVRLNIVSNATHNFKSQPFESPGIAGSQFCVFHEQRRTTAEQSLSHNMYMHVINTQACPKQ